VGVVDRNPGNGCYRRNHVVAARVDEGRETSLAETPSAAANDTDGTVQNKKKAAPKAAPFSSAAKHSLTVGGNREAAKP
jgi:hypothetical protein